MRLKYVPHDRNACGYPMNHLPDKCFELSVSRNELLGMAHRDFPKSVIHLEPSSNPAAQVKPRCCALSSLPAASRAHAHVPLGT